jgi:quinol monooxygenase YgiN
MILTSLEFRVKEGGADALADVYRRHRILEVAATVPGCLDLYYAVSTQDPQLVTVVGLWEDRAAYDRWLEHPYRDTAEDEFDAQMAGDWEPTAAAVISDVLVSARGTGRILF